MQQRPTEMRCWETLWGIRRHRVLSPGKRLLACLTCRVACLLQMKAYCEDKHTCRHALLLDYFGERFRVGSCGACDNCLGTSDGPDSAPEAPQVGISVGTGLLPGLPAETEACSRWVQVPAAHAKQLPGGMESTAAVGKPCADAAFLLRFRSVEQLCPFL